MLTPDEEAGRLRTAGVRGGVPVAVVSCEDPELVLKRARSVFEVVLNARGTSWPTLGEWAVLLPQWFVEACADPESDEGAERWLSWWRTLSPEDQADATDRKPWTLHGWLYWFEDGRRTWQWLGAGFSDDTMFIELEVDEWPTALGALTWLLHACGATNVAFH